MAHLGGHLGRTNLEEGSLTYLKKTLNITSMIDIGCGTGGMVDFARKIGLDSLGVDGDPAVGRPGTVNIHDFSLGKYPNDKVYDLGYSVEFLEHVEDKYIPNYMPLFQKCKYVLMTGAPEKWTGNHHVNCQSHEYWIKIFNQYGFVHDPYQTVMCRRYSTMNNRHVTRKKFVKLRCLFFVNLKYSDNIELVDETVTNLSELKKNVYYKSQSYQEIEINELNVTLPKVPNHIFKSTVPTVSLIS